MILELCYRKTVTYSDMFINHTIVYVLAKRALLSQGGNNNHDGNNDRRLKYFRLPFLGKSSSVIKKLLEELDSKIKIAFCNHNTLKEQKLYSYTKDPVPLLKKSGVIYSIPCGDCPHVYVGETCQYLDKRLNSHKSDVRNNKDTTALAC